jgi:hypothetical protein
MTEIHKTKQKPIIKIIKLERIYFTTPEQIAKFLKCLQMKGDIAI